MSSCQHLWPFSLSTYLLVLSVRLCHYLPLSLSLSLFLASNTVCAPLVGGSSMMVVGCLLATERSETRLSAFQKNVAYFRRIENAPVCATLSICCLRDGKETGARTNERANEWANERTNERTNERKSEQTDERTNGRTDERTNGRTNERLTVYNPGGFTVGETL